jgi:hypothetical protein
MKSECPSPFTPPYPQEETNNKTSRLIDEKISDNSGTEAKADKAMAPAGLKNPFWK